MPNSTEGGEVFVNLKGLALNNTPKEGEWR
jgi:hypothetical protein